MSSKVAALFAAGMMISVPAMAGAQDAAPAAAAPEATQPEAAAPAVEAAAPAAEPMAVAAPPAAAAEAPAQAAAVDLSRPVVTYVDRPMGGFSLMTPGKAAFGMIGAIAQIAESNRIKKENQLLDPGVDIAFDLAKVLAEQRQLSVAKTPMKAGDPIPVTTEDGAKVAYLIDMQSSNVLVSYYSFDWVHFHANYWGKLVIMDPTTKKVLVQAKCKAESPKEGAPTHSALLDDNAAGLKALISQTANVCFEKLKPELSKLPS